jgi:hypothetical protein
MIMDEKIDSVSGNNLNKIVAGTTKGYEDSSY